MASFSEFLSTLDPEAVRRGAQFERFIKWFLKNDPEWETQVQEVWLWTDYPGRWGRDKGIDLVFKDKSGKTWAVQAKCYAKEHEITKADVDKFLSESNRLQIDQRLLIATTDRLGSNAKEVLEAQEKPVVRYLLNHFEDAKLEFPTSIAALDSGRRKRPPDPRPHQIEAIENVLLGFQTADRGQVVMACGTGKTYVSLWVKERLKARRTLVLLPSLGLLSQTLNEWTYARKDRFDVLCVCSDQTVNGRNEDESVNLVSDLPFRVTNDVSEIVAFLRRDQEQVVFSTYHSSPLISEAQQDCDVANFDLVIADEAHRVAGKIDGPFQTVLDDSKVRGLRRLFVTATPRVYKRSLKRAAAEVGVDVIDMNDDSVFGKRFHTLTFGEAIKRELLTDYRVLIVGVDNRLVREWIENRHLVATDSGFVTDAKSLATLIGLLKAIKDWNLQRLISFHGRVKRAKAFAQDIISIIEWLDEAHRPLKRLWADYVSGEMPTIARKQKLRRLTNSANEETGLLSNARCLSEGIDVPSLDGIAFIDPRSSEIDIIQSVGRAIRLSNNKLMGTIVIPVFIEALDNAEEELKSSNFKPIWDVLEALKAHDDRLSNELDLLRIRIGRNRRQSIISNDLTNIVFDLPTSVDETFAQALCARIVETTTQSWMFWFGLLQAFASENGHARVVSGFRTSDNFSLGSWVGIQRATKHKMNADYRQRLESLPGWSWDVYSDRWEDGFNRLTGYANEYGNVRVAQRYKTLDGFKLGAWVFFQRTNKPNLDIGRIERLDALPGWRWDPFAEKWEMGFAHLREFLKREGHCQVPYTCKIDGYRLGVWVANQRLKASKKPNTQIARDPFDAGYKQRLEELPGWSWSTLEEKWERFFADLQAFSNETGHCQVPHSYRTENGLALMRWVVFQKDREDQLEPSRRKRLEALSGWSWPRRVDEWEQGFAQLKSFVERAGHCEVPKEYKQDGYSLGRWVQTQAATKHENPDRQRRLEALPDWSWKLGADRFEKQWENAFQRLKEFSETENLQKLTLSYKTEDGFALGIWVRGQRQKRASGRLNSLVQQQLLEALPGWSWSPGADKSEANWQAGFECLKDFSHREGHSLVLHDYATTDGFQLGRWVSVQRLAFGRGRMRPDKQQRLELLPGWSWKAQK